MAVAAGRIFFLSFVTRERRVIYIMFDVDQETFQISPLNEMLRTVGLLGGSVMDFAREDLRRFRNRLPAHCPTNKWFTPHEQFLKRNRYYISHALHKLIVYEILYRQT